MPIVGDLVDGDTDSGVGAHPRDLLSHCGEGEQRTFERIEHERYRDDVRLVVESAGQPADVHAREHAVAFVVGQFVDDHETEL